MYGTYQKEKKRKKEIHKLLTKILRMPYESVYENAERLLNKLIKKEYVYYIFRIKVYA